MKIIYIFCLLSFCYIKTGLTSHIESSDIEIDDDNIVINQTHNHNQLKDRENSSYTSVSLQQRYPEGQEESKKSINRQRGEGLPYTEALNISKERALPKIYKQ